ncbi:hypothetical protein EV361DRAFT_966983 [Lentinula raphanica]|nr:hypothetical protein EV361DRAFT_966983 [Lentinula raphanica]
MSIISVQSVRNRLVKKLELRTLQSRIEMITSAIPDSHSFTTDDNIFLAQTGQETFRQWIAEDFSFLGVQRELIVAASNIVHQVIADTAFSTAFFWRLPQQYQIPNVFDLLPIATGLAKDDPLFRQRFQRHFTIPFAFAAFEEIFGMEDPTPTPPSSPPANSMVTHCTDPLHDSESPSTRPSIERSKWSSDTEDRAVTSDDELSLESSSYKRAVSSDDESSSNPSKRARKASQEVAAGKRRRVEVDRSSSIVRRNHSSRRSSQNFWKSKRRTRTNAAAMSSVSRIQTDDDCLMGSPYSDDDLAFSLYSTQDSVCQNNLLTGPSTQILGASDPSESPAEQFLLASASSSVSIDIHSPIASPDPEPPTVPTNPPPVAGSTAEESNKGQAKRTRSLSQQSISSLSMPDPCKRTNKPNHPTSKTSRASYTIENSPVKPNSAFGSVANAIEHFNKVGIPLAPQGAARLRQPQADPPTHPTTTVPPQAAKLSQRRAQRVFKNDSAKNPVTKVSLEERNLQLDHVSLGGAVIILLFLAESYPSLRLSAVLFIVGFSYLCLEEMGKEIRAQGTKGA